MSLNLIYTQIKMSMYLIKQFNYTSKLYRQKCIVQYVQILK
jgi:hypothetical protein